MNNKYAIDEFMLSTITKDLMQQKEDIILEQLNELVSRGLLVVESTRPVLVQDSRFDLNAPYKITLQQKVKLVLKDQEYIKKLEKENAEYLDLISRLNLAFERTLKNV